jgi:hypothetical protein
MSIHGWGPGVRIKRGGGYFTVTSEGRYYADDSGGLWYFTAKRDDGGEMYGVIPCANDEIVDREFDS